MRIGVISDTHGLVRAEPLAALAGSELIVHAGDVDRPDVLAALAKIAPVRAVRGNNDKGAWAKRLPASDAIEIGGHTLYVIHDLKELEVDAVAAGFAAVIAGHSHRPRNEVVDGVLYFNPGSAGPRRFSLPVTVGRIDVGRRLEASIIDLGV
ncbi:MAG: metallophosphoesterase family protein [Polyangia bacterium]